MLRDNTIYLLNCVGLDTSYNHSYMFKNKQSQYNYFLSKVVLVINDTVFNKRNQSIIVDKYIYDRQLELCNYCMFLNENNKPEYYFIDDKIYKSDESTQLVLKLDVFQTFIFDVGLLSTSYVDRYHQQKYFNRVEGRKLNKQIFYEDEGLEVGEYRINNIMNVYDYSNRGVYIATSSTCLTTPVAGQNGEGGQGGQGGQGELWKQGLVSENGFLLIKSMEAFSSVPYNIGDGTNTIGYGTTQKYDTDNYNSLAPSCTEKQASEVFANSLDNNYASRVLNLLKNSGKDLSTVKQCHFDAFVSFCYNHYSIQDDDIWIMYINGASEQEIAERWKTTVIMSGSQFEQGLRDRREREANAFLGTYNPKQIQNLQGGYVTENNGKGHIPDRYIVNTPSSSELRDNIVRSAEKLLGKPYRYGGNYPPLGSSDGTDCSGLCQWAYNDNGIKITRTTYTQIKEGRLITQAEARKGDLVFTRGYGDNGHVVMFLSDNGDGTIKVIEAKQTGTNIMYNTRKVNDQYMFRNLLGD